MAKMEINARGLSSTEIQQAIDMYIDVKEKGLSGLEEDLKAIQKRREKIEDELKELESVEVTV